MSHARVLVIDDDADFRASVRALLEAHGYEVAEADSGREGLRQMAARRPDLILLDIMMECCCEGYGVVHTIKYDDAYLPCRGVPVIMISSIQECPDERFPMSAEVELIRPDLYLTKPLDIPRFLEVVSSALTVSAARR